MTHPEVYLIVLKQGREEMTRYVYGTLEDFQDGLKERREMVKGYNYGVKRFNQDGRHRKKAERYHLECFVSKVPVFGRITNIR